MDDILVDLVTSGRIADLLIAVMLIEVVVLVGYRVASGRGYPVPHIISSVLAGLFLVLALRAALVGAPWYWIAASLAAAGAAHLADVVLRWPAA